MLATHTVHRRHDSIAIVDFGSQFTGLITRRIRELGVYAEVVGAAQALPWCRSNHPRGVILSGGPASVLTPNGPTIDGAVFSLGIPVLGICYGFHLMGRCLGGRVVRAPRGEYGAAKLERLTANALIPDAWMTGDQPRVWMSFSDRMEKAPPGFSTLAASENTPCAIMADDRRALYGVQFHPEVSHTEGGLALLKRFLFTICRARSSWSMESFEAEAVAKIRETVGAERVICAVSGGVDSSVMAALLSRAVNDRVLAVFIDNGLLRTHERQNVERALREELRVKLTVVDARQRFLDALAGIDDPERKRKVIGQTFVEVFQEVADAHGGSQKPKYLAQGTLYSDVIESAGQPGAALIKSHHNVGGLPKDLRFELLEPLRDLFKDEVRALGRVLGLPAAYVNRHPFPGPGLAVRIRGNVTPDRLAILRSADRIFLEELHREGYHEEIWQAFAVLLPLRTVGVMGDRRTYGQVCALRAVTASDGMTADVFPLPMALVTRIARRIVNEVDDINRVVLDVTSKPPATIEWE